MGGATVKGRSKYEALVGRVYDGCRILSVVIQSSSARVLCECSCGTQFTTKGIYLTTGRTKSCGCRRVAVNKKTHGTHLRSRTPEYRSWYSMNRRCYDESADNFERYGGAGITVCDRWRDSFESFLQDMGPRPQGTTLDRIDGSGGYYPENCRWATVTDQNKNRTFRGR